MIKKAVSALCALALLLMAAASAAPVRQEKTDRTSVV